MEVFVETTYTAIQEMHATGQRMELGFNTENTKVAWETGYVVLGRFM